MFAAALTLLSEATIQTARLKPLLEALQSYGYQVRSATLESFCAGPQDPSLPQLVLLDLDSGLEPATETITHLQALMAKQKATAFDIFLIADTANQDDIVALMRQGANGYFLGTSAALLDIDLRVLLSQYNHRQHSAAEIALDQKAGHAVQQHLLPNSPSRIQGFRFEHRVFPSVVMSGDSVDFFPIDKDKTLFYLADVSGHGAAAAMVGVAVNATARQLREDYESLAFESTADLLAWFNRKILAWNFDQHMTMFVGILDNRNKSLQYSNAAHFPGVMFKADDKSGFLEMGGLPLGICDTQYQFQQLHWNDQLELVLFSDGVLEIMHQASIQEKEETLLSLLEYGQTDIEQWTQKLGLDSELSIPDDIAILTVRSVNAGKVI